MQSPDIPANNNDAPGTGASFLHHRFHVLDGMRGVAAFLVVLYHYYFTAISQYCPNMYVALDFFFILSGYVVSHAYGDKLRGGMSSGSYLARRIARLFPMMAIGLCLGLPLLYAATMIGRTDYSKVDLAVSTICNFVFLPYLNHHKIFLSNGFIQGRIFPADTPLWSIFFEMVASVAFLWLVKYNRRILAAICAISFVLIGVAAWHEGAGDGVLNANIGFATQNIWGGFPRVFYGFVCGMILYCSRDFVSGGRWARIENAVSRPALLYLLLFIVIMFPFSLAGGFYFIIIALLAPALVTLGGRITTIRGPWLAVSEKLGWLSYPLYCVHEPVHRLVVGASMHFDFRNRIVMDAASLCGSIAVATVCGLILDRFIQRRFTRLMDRLIGGFGE